MQSLRGETNVCVRGSDVISRRVPSPKSVFHGIGNIVDNRAHVEEEKRREDHAQEFFFFWMILLSHLEVRNTQKDVYPSLF